MNTNAPRKTRLATVWLAGCSGCHMSFLDLDTWLLELADRADIVYSPVGSDRKVYPENVDVALVEGGVANTDNLELLQRVRANTRTLVSFGDCAITANIPGMRNMLRGSDPVLRRAYLELADGSGHRWHGLTTVAANVHARPHADRRIHPVQQRPGCGRQRRDG